MPPPAASPSTSSGGRGWRWAWLASATVLLVFVALTAFEGWMLVAVYPMQPKFVDWVNVLSSAETFASGADPYRNNPADPYGRLFSYGPWWLWLGRIGLTRADAWWLGGLLALGFLATAAATLRPRDAREAGWFCVLLASPPVLLGLERGNSDLLIFMLLAIAGWLVGRERSAGAQVAAAGLIVGAAALKFYPLVALAGLGARRGAWARRIIWMGSGAVAFWALWWLQAEDYAIALNEAIRPLSVFTYGLPLLPISWRALAEFRLLIVLGGLPVLLLGLWLVWRTRADWARLFPLHGGRAAAVVAGTSAWLLCYGVSASFQYRAVLLLFAVPFLLGQSMLRWAVAWLALVFWLAAPLFWFAPGRSQESWRALSALVTGVQQAALGVVTLGLVLALAGWTWRRYDADRAKAVATVPTP